MNPAETEPERVGSLARATASVLPVLLVLAGLVWSMGWALIPSRGVAGGCGTPVVDALSASHDAFEVSCQREGLLHVAMGVMVGALVVWGGLLVLLEVITVGNLHRFAPSLGADQSGQSRRSRTALALVAVVMVLLAVTIAGTATYASGSQIPSEGPAG